MDEILFIFSTYKESLYFLRELARDLDEKNIFFKYNEATPSLETKFCKIICQSINNPSLRHIHRKVKYYVKRCKIEDINKIISLKLNAKEIKDWKKIIKLLSGEVC